ncbi:hypothetical protein [Lacrimispora algidixylanolytica]|nr:hypothetical protein [Lacrimispora algidixylanolytica]
MNLEVQETVLKSLEPLLPIWHMLGYGNIAGSLKENRGGKKR